MGSTFFFPWEVDLMAGLQQFAGPVTTALATFFTLFGEEVVLVGIMAIVFYGFDKELGKSLGTGVLLSILSGSVLKNLLFRRRPYFDHAGIQCLRAVDLQANVMDTAAQGYSMPSLHASNSVVIFGSLARKLKKNWATVVGILMPLCIGISRIFLGVHYPTDVLAGWVLGVLSMALVILMEKSKVSSLVRAIGLAVIFLPGWFICKTSDFYSAYGLIVGVEFGFVVEEKKINFDNTDRWLFKALRALGGAAAFLAISQLLKLPFPAGILEGTDFAAHFVRSARYACASFASVGILPFLFRPFESMKIFKKG